MRIQNENCFGIIIAALVQITCTVYDISNIKFIIKNPEFINLCFG